MYSLPINSNLDTFRLNVLYWSMLHKLNKSCQCLLSNQHCGRRCIRKMEANTGKWTDRGHLARIPVGESAPERRVQMKRVSRWRPVKLANIYKSLVFVELFNISTLVFRWFNVKNNLIKSNSNRFNTSIVIKVSSSSIIQSSCRQIHFRTR